MFNPFRPKTVRETAPSGPPAPVESAPQKPLVEVVTNRPPAVAPLPSPPPPPLAPPIPPVVLAPAPPPAPPAAVPPAPYAPPAAATNGPLPLSTAATTALEQLVAKLPGLLFAGLTEAETGAAIRGRTPNDVLPAAAIARYHADVIRLERQALQQTSPGVAPEALREMLITMTDQLHLLRLVRGGELLLSIVLDPRLVSLPVARIALQAAATLIG